MSRVDYIKCDLCGVLTENPYAKKGWITINDGFSLTKAKGHYNDSHYETDHFKIGKDCHFCSEHCFIEFLKKEEILSEKILSPPKPDLKDDELVSTFII
jgi:hypothetical protein